MDTLELKHFLYFYVFDQPQIMICYKLNSDRIRTIGI